MCTPFHDASLVEHADFVSILDGAQSVGNSYRRTGLHQSLQCILYQPFALRIEGRGRLIQDQDGRILEDGPGNAEKS